MILSSRAPTSASVIAHCLRFSTRHATVAIAACAALCGCAHYERRPLDIGATRASWLARSASDAPVSAFAASLQGFGASGGQKGWFDPSDGLNLAEAEAVAMVYNPDLRQARLELGVTRATAAFAGLWQDPVLGVDLERIISGTNGANPWIAGSTLGITLPISGRLGLEKKRAGAEVAAELERLAAKEWATRSALRELWIEWSAARVREELANETASHLSEIATLAQEQEKAGSITRVEASFFQVELLGRRADIMFAQGRVAELQLQLRAMLGLSPVGGEAMVPSLTFTPRVTDGLGVEEAARTSIDVNNPELRAVRAAYEVAEQSLRVEIRSQYPDLTIGPGYGTDQGDNRVLLSLSMPVGLWNRNQRGVAEAIAQRDAAQGRFEITYEQLSMKLALALARYQSGRAQRQLIELQVVPLADAQQADVGAFAALGRIEPLLLLESLKARFSAKMRLVDAVVAESLGAVRIDELLGPGNLTSSEPGFIEYSPGPQDLEGAHQ